MGGVRGWVVQKQYRQDMIAPKLFGGITAKTPVEGRGVEEPDQAFFLRHKKYLQFCFLEVLCVVSLFLFFPVMPYVCNVVVIFQ